MEKVRAIILTGLSGSGKSTAMHALEDVGYFCVDNLPATLLQTFLLLCGRNEEVSRVGLVMDVREPRFAATHAEAIERALALGMRIDVLFLDAQDDALIRRFHETRRSHPLMAGEGTIGKALSKERQILEGLRDQATLVVDTSRMNVHELKRRVQDFAATSDEAGQRHMRVSVLSFGFKHGLPTEASYVIDVRFIPNPYFDESLRPLDGRHPGVQQFISAAPESKELQSRMFSLIDYVVPQNEQEGKAELTLAIGCTGGRHRSVFFAERLADHLCEQGFHANVFHRDVERV